MNMFNFGKALELLKDHKKVARNGWNGKGMFLYLTTGSEVPATGIKSETANHLFGNRLLECDTTVKISPHIDLKSVDGSITVGWTASQTDMLADDWFNVE